MFINKRMYILIEVYLYNDKLFSSKNKLTYQMDKFFEYNFVLKLKSRIKIKKEVGEEYIYYDIS